MALSRLLALAWPHRIQLLLATFLMVLESITVLAIPLFAGFLASGIATELEGQVGRISLIIIALLAFQTLIKVIYGRITSRISESILADLRKKLYNHIQDLPIAFFHSRRQGDIISLLFYEVDQLSSFITSTLVRIIPTALVLVGAAAAMFNISPLLTLPVVVGIPIFFVTMKLLGRRLRPLGSAIRTAYADSLAIAEANLSMLPVIKSFTREEIESQRHAGQVDRVKELTTELGRVQATLAPVVQFLAAAGIVFLMWAAGDRVMQGDMAAGELISFLLYSALLTRPVSSIADLWGQTQHANGALDNLDRTLSLVPEQTRGTPGRAIRSGEIRFEQVRFSHTGRTPALFDINFTVRSGETVALTGPNGAGKTTIADLLLRFHDPDSGRIFVDGTDITEFSLHRLRRAIGVVPQQVFLFNATVGENIAVGKPNASEEEIRRACQLAQADAFIDELPEKLSTRVGDRGVRLSGGQRQRLALARALLKDPAILIMDEPTAMFDPEGELSFVRDARRALRGRTMILITHRPASLELADRILVLEKGRIVREVRDET